MADKLLAWSLSIHDSFAFLIFIALMKFFGTMARQHPKEVFGQHKDFVNILFGRLSSQDVIAAQTVCFIGETVGGKLALNKLGRVCLVCSNL